MRCWNCRYNLRGLETGHCPECGAWFSTGAQVIPMVRRLRCTDGPRRCVVCRRDLTGVAADRCPSCSSRLAVRAPGAA